MTIKANNYREKEKSYINIYILHPVYLKIKVFLKSFDVLLCDSKSNLLILKLNWIECQNTQVITKYSGGH